jgi:hypothetical protein
LTGVVPLGAVSHRTFFISIGKRPLGRLSRR